jgi:hypothetical protein
MIFAEVVPDEQGVGLARFSAEVTATIAEYFPASDGMIIDNFYGDPAGRVRDPLFETTFFDHLHSLGLPVMEAPSQDPQLRIEAIRSPFGKMFEGKPGILIHPRCRNLIKGLQGAWSYRRLQVSSASERFKDKPEKNQYSHVCDALGYMLIGAGEGNALRGRGFTNRKSKPGQKAKFGVNLFGKKRKR